MLFLYSAGVPSCPSKRVPVTLVRTSLPMRLLISPWIVDVELSFGGKWKYPDLFVLYWRLSMMGEDSGTKLFLRRLSSEAKKALHISYSSQPKSKRQLEKKIKYLSG